MSKNQRKILGMLFSNKINVGEACRLLFMVEPEARALKGTPPLRTTGMTQTRYMQAWMMPAFHRFR